MAGRGIELGAGYVSLTVSTSGLGRTLNAEFGAVSKAAEDTGRKAGGLFSKAFGAGTKQAAADAKAAAEEAASARVAADRRAEQSAVALEAAQAKVTKATEAHAKAVATSGTESGAAKDAHAKLAQAKLAEADASARAETAAKEHEDAIEAASKAAGQAEQANTRYERSLAGLSSKAAAGIASPFRKLAEAADKDGRISGNKLVQGIKAGTSRIGEAIGNNPFGKLVTSAGDAAKKAGAKLHDGIKGSIGKIGGMMKAGLVGIGAGAAASIGGVLSAGFGRYTALEDARAKLQGLGHDAKNVEGIMNSALTSVKGTSHGMAEAASVSASLVASGVKPGEELTGVLKTVGNSASLAGMSMSEMGAIFGKAAAMGKIDGEILSQLADRGVPAIQWLAKETGMSSEEVMKAASEGRISFETFTTAMEKGAGDAAAALGQTTTGSIKNFGASIGRLGESIISAFAGEGGIASFFQRLTAGVDNLETKVGPAVERIRSFVSGLLEQFRSGGGAENAERVLMVLRVGFEGIWSAVQNMWSVVQPILQQVWEAIAVKWAELQPKVSQIFSTVVAAVRDAMGVVQGIIQIVTGVIRVIWDTFGTQIVFIVTNLMGAVVRIFQGLANVVGGIFKTLSGLLTGDWQKMGDGLKQITQGVWQVITGIFQGLLGTLVGIFDSIVVGIGSAWDKITGKVRTPIVAVIDVIWGGLGAAWGKVAELLGLRSFPDRPAGFKRGGILPGYTPVHQGDDQLVPMRSGEGVSVSEAMRSPYERDRLHRLNQAALRGPAALAKFQAAEANPYGGLATGGLVWPVPRSTFNLRYPSYPGHTGVDAANPKGTPIRALRDGRVQSTNTYTTREGYWGVSPGYGIDTVLDHGTFATRYSHQSGRAIAAGQQVTAGQVIGYVGSTGKSTGPHLHFEVLSGGRQVNPVPYLNGATQGEGGAVGGGWNPIQDFLDLIAAPFKGLRDQLAGTPIGQMAIGFGEKIRDAAIDKIKGVAGNVAGAVSGVGNRALGAAMAARRGWIGNEWASLEKLWTKESNWRTTAENPSSGAYGIPQALPGSKMSSHGADWRTNPGTQIAWGLDYIGGRYKTPSAAWAHSQRVNWYKAGTRHAARGYAVVGEEGPELLKLAGGEEIRPALRPHEMARQIMHTSTSTIGAGTVVNNPIFQVDISAADLRQVASVVELMGRLGLEANRIGA